MSSLIDRGAGRPWQRLRLRVLARDRHQCVVCGATEGLQVDHIVERQFGGGDDLANLQTLCLGCHQRKSGANYARRAGQADTPRDHKVSMDDPATPRPPVAGFHSRNASHGGLTGTEEPGPPRFWPEPHPDAVGTRGGELAQYAAEVIGQPLLPWERDVADILLEVRADGRWCRPVWVIIASRQSGKSTLFRALASWLARQGQVVLTCSAKLQSTQHLMRPEQLRHRSDPEYRVTFSKEQPECNYPGWTEESHRWIGQAANAMFGRSFTADTLIVDEGQDVPPTALEAASPTQTERPNPLTIITGTGTRADSEALLAEHRAIALEGGPVALIEWSAPAGSDWLDEEVWRAASPRWTVARLHHMRKEVAKGEGYIRSEYLCQQVQAAGSEPWLDMAAWQAARRSVEAPAKVDVAAVEDGRGGTGGSVALAWTDGGIVHVYGYQTESLDAAWREASRAERVVCGITLRNERQALDLRAQPRGRRETATALPELRRLLAVSGLAWDGDDLDAQMRGVVVREDSTGSLTVAASTPTGVLRAAAWAVQAVRISREPVLI